MKKTINTLFAIFEFIRIDECGGVIKNLNKWRLSKEKFLEAEKEFMATVLREESIDLTKVGSRGEICKEKEKIPEKHKEEKLSGEKTKVEKPKVEEEVKN